MKASLKDYVWVSPRSLPEALEYLSRQRFHPMAGGTDLMVLFEAGRLPPGAYMNLLNLKELKGIEVRKDEIILGALTTFTELRNHPVIRKEFRMLRDAARVIGSIAIQNRGTLGGNIVNASPAADSCPALLAYDARIEVQSASETRMIPYSEFHTGYKQTQLRSDELLTKIILKRDTKDTQVYYRKVGTREAQAISKTCLSAMARVQRKKIEEIRIAFASVAPIPLRCVKTERSLLGRTIDPEMIIQARSVLASELSPVDDLRSTRNYRIHISQNLLEEFLSGLK